MRESFYVVKIFIFLCSLLVIRCHASSYEEELRSISMSDHVFVVSEWLPKENHEDELWDFFKELMTLTKKSENGCIRAHATRQISHPGAPGKSKYTIVLLQEYRNIAAFDTHCQSDYVKDAFQKYVENKETSIVEEWRCRLFGED